MAARKFKHYFFDMDGTLTESRTKMELEMTHLLKELSAHGDIVVVSGASIEQVHKQMAEELHEVYYALTQNGNAAYDRVCEKLWANTLTWQQKWSIFNWIKSYIVAKNMEHVEDLVEDRGCQISFSLIGHHAALDLKAKFDPKGVKRLSILNLHPIVDSRIEAAVGGTTCIDFFSTGNNKGSNVAALGEQMGWAADDCVYVGDQLYDGGNDSSVPAVNPKLTCVRIKDTDDTKKFIKTQL